MNGGYFVPKPRKDKAAPRDKTVRRVVLIVPSHQDSAHEELCRELECYGIKASVDAGLGPISLDGINRVLVIIPNDNEKRWAEIRSLALKASVQVSFAGSGTAAKQLLEDLEL